MDWQINNSAFKVQVLSTLAMPRRFQNFSVCLGNASAKKNSQRPNRYFCIYLGMPQHFAKGYDLVFKQLRLLVLPNYIVYLWNTWIGETKNTFSLVDHLFLVLILVLILIHFRSSRPDVFYKKAVLRNFAKYTGKHLC